MLHLGRICALASVALALLIVCAGAQNDGNRVFVKPLKYKCAVATYRWAGVTENQMPQEFELRISHTGKRDENGVPTYEAVGKLKRWSATGAMGVPEPASLEEFEISGKYDPARNSLQGIVSAGGERDTIISGYLMIPETGRRQMAFWFGDRDTPITIYHSSSVEYDECGWCRKSRAGFHKGDGVALYDGFTEDRVLESSGGIETGLETKAINRGGYQRVTLKIVKYRDQDALYDGLKGLSKSYSEGKPGYYMYRRGPSDDRSGALVHGIVVYREVFTISLGLWSKTPELEEPTRRWNEIVERAMRMLDLRFPL